MVAKYALQIHRWIKPVFKTRISNPWGICEGVTVMSKLIKEFYSYFDAKVNTQGGKLWNKYSEGPFYFIAATKSRYMLRTTVSDMCLKENEEKIKRTRYERDFRIFEWKDQNPRVKRNWSFEWTPLCWRFCLIQKYQKTSKRSSICNVFSWIQRCQFVSDNVQ